MSQLLALTAVLVAAFVGANVGGSNTGVAFGPAVGTGITGKTTAAALMTVFAFLGGWTVGRNVIDTLGGSLVQGTPYTVASAIAVLVLVGVGTALANAVGVPTSTSMTTVGVISGLGLATDVLAGDVLAWIVGWSLLSTLLSFWLSALVGRYWYAHVVDVLSVERTDGPMLVRRRGGRWPPVARGPETTVGELAGAAVVVAVACVMAFGAGANNVANVVAPLVGNGLLTVDEGVLLATAAIGAGALTIARRVFDTVGDGLAALELPAAIVVALVSASLSIGLSALGVPASFVLIATMSIVGLGWGRAARAAAAVEPVAPTDEQLYDAAGTARVVVLQGLVPALAACVSFLTFSWFPIPT